MAFPFDPPASSRAEPGASPKVLLKGALRRDLAEPPSVSALSAAPAAMQANEVDHRYLGMKTRLLLEKIHYRSYRHIFYSFVCASL